MTPWCAAAEVALKDDDRPRVVTFPPPGGYVFDGRPPVPAGPTMTPPSHSCENRRRMDSLHHTDASDSPAAGPPAEAAPSLGARFKRDLGMGLKAGLQTFWTLARVMIPAYGATLILERLGVIEWLARAARPLMSLLGLPGDAAVPLIVGYVLNIYAAVGSMQALDLNSRQITVLAIAILIGHNLLVEGAVLHKAGANGFAFSALRVVAGLIAAAVANLLMGLVS